MLAADTAGVLWAVVIDTVIGGGRGVLDVVSGAAPVSKSCGSAVDTVPVALVTVSEVDSATDAERRARAPEAVAVEVKTAFELVVVGVHFFMRLIPWPRMSGVFCFVLVSGRFGALSFFCSSAFSARSRITSASEPVTVSEGVGAAELEVGRVSVRVVICGSRSSPSAN